MTKRCAINLVRLGQKVLNRGCATGPPGGLEPVARLVDTLGCA
jgi:hypothetical protein